MSPKMFTRGGWPQVKTRFEIAATHRMRSSKAKASYLVVEGARVPAGVSISATT